MVRYKYQAMTEDGKKVRGVMGAEDIITLQNKLKEEQLFLASAKEIKTNQRQKRIKSKDLAEFARNLGRLIQSGISMVRALKIISDDESINIKQRRIYAELLKQVRSGQPLSEALSDQENVFPPLFINMIKSAEATGQLDTTALQMAEYYEKEHKLTQKVKSSMTYPKILVVLLIGVLAVIMGYVMPQFANLFAKLDKIPLPTRILMAISDYIAKKWYVLLIGAGVLFVIGKLLLGITQVRYWKDKLILKMPLIGKLQKVIFTARFARTLASLYSAGISILPCLQIAKNTIGNVYIESQFDDVIATIRSGGTLSEAIEQVDGFVNKLPSSVMVGEETGQLDKMLVDIADQLEYDSEIAITKMVSMLEPAMIVVMAILVGFIMISVIQPIYQSYGSIGAN